MKDVDYQPPETIPISARKMNKQQSKNDISLKGLQYMASGVFRPLDFLALEISRDHDNPNVQRYLQMLPNCQLLLLNLSSQMNEMRNTLAFQAMNPNFILLNSSANNKYTISLTDFQTTLTQQTSTIQTYNKATSVNKKPRFNSNSNQQQGFNFNTN